MSILGAIMTNETVFLIGAGASYGCKNVLPSRPPTGDKLFSILEQKYPEIMNPIIKKIGKDCTDNFEQKMYEISKNSEIELIPLNKILAKYFSTFRVNSTNNTYSELIKLLNDKNTNFVLSTLNYDCLLEHASLQLGILVTYVLNDQEPCTKIMKLHGSCNFAMGLSGIKFAGPPVNPIKVEFGGSINGPVKYLDPETVCFKIDNFFAGPVMSYYMKGKPTNVGGSFITNLQNQWKELVLNAKKIIIIGISPNFEDAHIWDSIKNTSAEIAYVGRKNGFDELYSEINNTSHIAENFEDSIPEIEKFL